MSISYKNLFIDLDDTLWDIHRNGKECLEEIYFDYGYNEFYPTFDDYYNVYMPSNHHLWNLYRQGEMRKDELIVERFLVPVREFGIDDPGYAKSLNDDFLERTTRKTRLIDEPSICWIILNPNTGCISSATDFVKFSSRK